jgi:hypothetical protein
MKKTITLFTAFLFSSCMLWAQQDKPVILGIKAGINRTDLSGRDSANKPTGFVGTEVYGGFIADIKLKKQWRLETGLGFSYTESVHYVEIPFFLKLMAKRNMHFMAGPRIDIIADPNEPEFYNFKRVGLAMEAGAIFNITPKLFAEIRYARGITKQTEILFLDINDARRNSLRIGLGIRFIKS